MLKVGYHSAVLGRDFMIRSSKNSQAGHQKDDHSLSIPGAGVGLTVLHRSAAGCCVRDETCKLQHPKLRLLFSRAWIFRRPTFYLIRPAGSRRHQV